MTDGLKVLTRAEYLAAHNAYDSLRTHAREAADRVERARSPLTERVMWRARADLVHLERLLGITHQPSVRTEILMPGRGR